MLDKMGVALKSTCLAKSINLTAASGVECKDNCNPVKTGLHDAHINESEVEEEEEEEEEEKAENHASFGNKVKFSTFLKHLDFEIWINCERRTWVVYKLICKPKV
ncbi:hypothetical protein FQA39_LY11090 [Lamprigera yunnana]|nr:hypothetical protein FQA39_LY11090 [Lamprigera yunnana]